MDEKRNSTTKIRLTCTIIFIVFTYLYLSCYQEDILAVAQHELSEGMTTYNYWLSPIWITLTLALLQVGVFTITRVKKTFHALTYFPSLLVLAVITDIPCNFDTHHSLGIWAWLLPALLLVFVGIIYVVRQLEPYENFGRGGLWFSRQAWLNLSQMLVMMLMVILIGNGHQVFHERMKMERLMKEGKYSEALQVGEKNIETDSSMTFLRVACLHKTKQMGDLLFTYSLVGGSKAMFLDSLTTKALLWKAPNWMVDGKVSKVKYILPQEYKLCGLLMDKKLDEFVCEILKKGKLNVTSLPKHYCEALMLYTHRRSHPKIVYRNAVMEADFRDFQAMERKYSNLMERKTALYETYGNTYWYYFLYGMK